MSPRLLQLFLKAPRPGTVKTRLAATAGDATATAIYRRLAERQLTALTDLPACRLQIQYTPADAEAEMRSWLGDGPDYRPQCEGDLGDRLSRAVNAAFEQGAERVYCLGADCPLLGPGHLRRADALLDDGADVVFGPATDGGYYLLGQTAHHPGLFRDIPWSRPDTLAVSRDRAARHRLTTALLPELYDVDTEHDWHRALRDQPALRSDTP